MSSLTLEVTNYKAFVIALLFGTTACANGMPLRGPSSLPVVHVTERENHKTVTIRRDQQLQIVLHSTYWQFQTLSRSSVLRLERKPQLHAKTPCVPGGGCGTVTATYRAVALGSGVVKAGRSSCGEALGCTAATGRFSLRVIVRA